MDYAAISEFTDGQVVVGGLGHLGVAFHDPGGDGEATPTGYLDLGFDLGIPAGRRLAFVINPRATLLADVTASGPAADVALTFEQLTAGWTSKRQRLRLDVGLGRPPIGVESPDEWLNAVATPSLVRAAFGPRRVLGLAVTHSDDHGWNFVTTAGLEVEDQRDEDPTRFPWRDTPPQSPDGDSSVAPATDLGAAFTEPVPALGFSIQRNDIAWEMRTGLTGRLVELEDDDAAADGGDEGEGPDDRALEGELRFGMQWFPMDLVTLTADGALRVGGARGCAYGQLLQAELAPHAPIRLDGRVEIAGETGSTPAARVGTGVALTSSGSALRLAGHVDWDLLPGAGGPPPDPFPDLVVVDLTLWMGAPHDRELGNLDPARLGLASDPRRIFGEQP